MVNREKMIATYFGNRLKAIYKATLANIFWFQTLKFDSYWLWAIGWIKQAI